MTVYLVIYMYIILNLVLKKHPLCRIGVRTVQSLSPTDALIPVANGSCARHNLETRRRHNTCNTYGKLWTNAYNGGRTTDLDRLLGIHNGSPVEYKSYRSELGNYDAYNSRRKTDRPDTKSRSELEKMLLTTQE